MTSKITPVHRAAGLAVIVALFSAHLHAQNYPSRPIRMVVPTSPGGVTDIVARAIAPQLSEALGQPIVIDNRAGAGGIPGTDAVAKAAPDGHTLLAVFDSFISNPHVFRNAPYDTIRDFAPVSLLVRGPQLFVVHPRLGVRTFNEFLAPANTPRAIIQRLNAVMIKLLAAQEQKERFAGLGYETVGSTPDEFGAWIRSETAKWSKVIREQNITAE